MYSYYFEGHFVETREKAVAEFFEYCISRRVDGKIQRAWTGITQIMIYDIGEYCKKHNIDTTPLIVAQGLSCFSSEYEYDKDTNSVRKNKTEEIWTKKNNVWTEFEFNYDAIDRVENNRVDNLIGRLVTFLKK